MSKTEFHWLDYGKLLNLSYKALEPQGNKYVILDIIK